MYYICTFHWTKFLRMRDNQFPRERTVRLSTFRTSSPAKGTTQYFSLAPLWPHTAADSGENQRTTARERFVMSGLATPRSCRPIQQCRLLFSYVCVLALPVLALSFAPHQQWNGATRSLGFDPSRTLHEPKRSLGGARVEVLRRPYASGRRNRGDGRLVRRAT